MFSDMYIETERLILRPLCPDDTDQLQAVVGQDEVVRYLPEDVMSRDEVAEIIDWLQDCYRTNSPERIIKFTVAVVLKETGKIIGWCGLGPLDFRPDEVEKFYGLDQACWNRGLATEAGGAMSKYAFETIGLEKIVAVVNPDNIASLRSIAKLGFTFDEIVTDIPAEHDFYSGFHHYVLSRDNYN